MRLLTFGDQGARGAARPRSAPARRPTGKLVRVAATDSRPGRVVGWYRAPAEHGGPGAGGEPPGDLRGALCRRRRPSDDEGWHAEAEEDFVTLADAAAWRIERDEAVRPGGGAPVRAASRGGGTCSRARPACGCRTEVRGCAERGPMSMTETHGAVDGGDRGVPVRAAVREGRGAPRPGRGRPGELGRGSLGERARSSSRGFWGLGDGRGRAPGAPDRGGPSGSANSPLRPRQHLRSRPLRCKGGRAHRWPAL
ncbi:MAG: hypothetical protein KatS3mg014_1247 [Actinomycetota bacterium]|nr:MAG: hypothetical protein KatS3mg014_1247 [Actinomycetota bacterium]